jgi:hypothetical protein
LVCHWLPVLPSKGGSLARDLPRALSQLMTNGVPDQRRRRPRPLAGEAGADSGGLFRCSLVQEPAGARPSPRRSLTRRSRELAALKDWDTDACAGLARGRPANPFLELTAVCRDCGRSPNSRDRRQRGVR